MLEHKTSKFEVKEVDTDSRVVKGYASVFNNLDSDNDVIKAGAFSKTIKEWGPEGKNRVKLVAQHKMSEPIGKFLKMEETPYGLYIEAKFGTHRLGEDYYRMAKEGIMDEFSVGFVPVEKTENEKGGYDITNIKLYEVSMVTVAANDRAVVTDVKSLNTLDLVKQVEDEELRHKLEYEVLKLQSEAQQTSTKTESEDVISKDSSAQEVEAKDNTLTDQLLKLYTTKN